MIRSIHVLQFSCQRRLMLNNVKYSGKAHLASSLIFACLRPSSRYISTLLSERRDDDAVARRSAMLCIELADIWREIEGTCGREEDEDENPGDRTGTIVGWMSSWAVDVGGREVDVRRSCDADHCLLPPNWLPNNPSSTWLHFPMSHHFWSCDACLTCAPYSTASS